MHFTAEETYKLLNFIGYGNLNARVWFIGMEERLPTEADVVAALRTRLLFAEVEDLYRAHCLLHEADSVPKYLKHHSMRFTQQKTWCPMCELMLRLNGNPEPTREQKRVYQAERLGRSGDETFLPEMLPLPAPDTSQWITLGYDKLFEPPEHFRTREVYRTLVMPQRIRLLREQLAKHKPPLVVCYGDSYRADFKAVFDTVSNWRTRDVFTIGNWQERKLVCLTPHLTHRKMNHKGKLLYELTIANGFNL